MRLSELLAPEYSLPSAADPDVSCAVSDSRRVTAGSVFVAIPGQATDGFLFAEEAQKSGAAAIVGERPRPDGILVPWIEVPDAREAAAILSMRAAGDPWKTMKLAAVTGTNGKTTTAVLLEGIFARAYGASGFIGTVFYRWTGHREEASRTTPEADRLAAFLSQMLARGVTACALEVSSHALALSRVAGLRFDATIFTNLTRDHLDFHRDFAGYAQAKEKLFSLRKEGAAAVINRDDAVGRQFLARAAPPSVSYSPAGDALADFWAADVVTNLEGTSLTVRCRDGSWHVESPLVGRFNVENLLAAWSGAFSMGIATETILAALSENHGAPGRMEKIEAGQPFPVIVDFAHTEDALRRLLSAVRELVPDRTIILVFGCGGDRDPGKREPMGRAAAELADIPIVTSDNPRTEDPVEILRQVERGIVAGGASKYLKFVDRREAIARAMELANPRAVVVIAGKGHETEQVIGTDAHPFDDRLVAGEFARAPGRRKSS